MLHRWSEVLIRRTRTVLALGVLATIAAGVFGLGVFDSLGQGGFNDPKSEASRELAQEQDTFGNKSVDIVAIYTSKDLTVSDPEFKAQVDKTLARIPADSTTSVATYWDTKDPSMVSKDKHATTVLISLVGKDQSELADSSERVTPTLSSEDLQTNIAGTWAVYKDVNETVSKDLAKAETVSMPLVIILSLLIFGSVVAALMPAVVGAIAVLGALAVVRLITGFTEVSVFSINVITLLGTGLAIDYALFVISRFREELARLPEDDPTAAAQAIRVTMSTAGRTVLFSGLTVAAAMASLLIFPQNFLRSLGYGGMAAVLVAVVAALTVLPAILLLLGRRIDAGRLPWRRHRPVQVDNDNGAFARLARVGDAPPRRGDGRRGGRPARRGLAVPRGEVGLGRLPRAAGGQSVPRRVGEAEHRVRTGDVHGQHDAADHRPGPGGGVHPEGRAGARRRRRTPGRPDEGPGGRPHPAARDVDRQQPDPDLAGGRPGDPCHPRSRR